MTEPAGPPLWVGGPLKPIPISPDPSGGPGSPCGDRRCCIRGPGGIRPGRVGVGRGGLGAESVPAGGAASPSLGPATLSDRPPCPPAGGRQACCLWEQRGPLGSARPSRERPPGSHPRVAQSLLWADPRGKYPQLSLVSAPLKNVSHGGPRDLRGPRLVDGA